MEDFTPTPLTISTLMDIYGTNESFVAMMSFYMGRYVSAKYLEKPEIIVDCKFNQNWGNKKEYNKILTSILRAYIDVYDEEIMNARYLAVEEVMLKTDDRAIFGFAEQYKILKYIHKILKDEMFYVTTNCPCCFKITVLN